MAAKRKKKTKKTKAQIHAQNQVMAVILLTLGILFVCLAFVRGSDGWLKVHDALLGLFGWGAFFIGPVMIYIAVMSSMDKLSNNSLSFRTLLTVVLLGLICAAFQIFLAGKPAAATLAAYVRALYSDGLTLRGGGVMSAALGYPLMLLGEPGDRIAVVLLLFLLTMILTGTTVASVIRSAQKPMLKISNGYHDFVNSFPPKEEESREGARSAQRASIDIPIDPAKPKKLPKRGTKDTAAAEVSPEVLRSKKKLLETAEAQLPVSESHPVTPKSDIEPVVPDEEGHQLFIDDIINRVAKVQANKEASARAAAVAESEEPQSENAAAPEPVEPPAYQLPPVTLLRESAANSGEITPEELRQNAQRLVDTLQSFGVQTRIIDISRGPAVTRYELQPSAGVKISRITSLADDIALNLAASGVRIEAPIPNKAAVGIEVPNRRVTPVTLREVVDSEQFMSAKSRVTAALGRDISGKICTFNIAKMPHLLIAGATGSGKSVCINTIIMSVLFKAKPDEVKLLLIDPKVVELGVYNGIPHLVTPVVTEPKKAAGALGWAVAEMLNRYKLFAANNARDIEAFNRMVELQQDAPAPAPGEDDIAQPKLSQLPHYIIVVDELADLMMAAPAEVEDNICRLAQMARAAGMHLIIATQRPSVDVITGLIKANIPSRIAFAVSSQIDSRTILDMGGAEKLLGQGDMLFSPSGSAKPTRVQGCYVSDDEIERVINFIKSSGTAQYDQQVLDDIDKHVPAGKGNSSAAQSGADGEPEDEMLAPAIECVVEAGLASTSLLQRKLKLGYARAARIIDELESRGIVGPFEGSKPRAVLISKERWIEMKMNRMDNDQQQ